MGNFNHPRYILLDIKTAEKIKGMNDEKLNLV